MNRLQAIPIETPLFVTLNPDRAPREDTVFARFDYDHTVYDAAAIAAQARLPAVQGSNRVWFAGAWTGYGFHEDGLASGLAAAQALGGTVPWER
jgi:predicted NAD/FAD-binding protein